MPIPVSPAEIAKAITDHQALLKGLMNVSSPMPSDEIPSFNAIMDKKIQVWKTQRGMIAQLRNSPGANGIVHGDDDTYHIFVDEDGDQPIAQEIGQREAIWFLIFHEYAHIIHEDVFEDDPKRVMGRYDLEKQQRESLANGYAASKTAERVSSTKTSKIHAVKSHYGWIGPCDDGYQDLVESS